MIYFFLLNPINSRAVCKRRASVTQLFVFKIFKKNAVIIAH